jgi:hypothetical protein
MGLVGSFAKFLPTSEMSLVVNKAFRAFQLICLPVSLGGPFVSYGNTYLSLIIACKPMN